MATPAVTASRRWNVLSGAAVLTGVALLAVKAVAILITGDQPPLLLEISPFFLGLGVLLLAPALELAGVRRLVVPVLGLISLMAGTIAAVTELTGEVWGPAIGTANLAAIVGAVVSGLLPGGDGRKRALVLVGVVVVPALILGGVLSEIDERLLEIGLLAYAAAWGLAGFRLVRWSEPA